MSSAWLTHHHSHSQSALHRSPAGLKLGIGLAVIVGTVLISPTCREWFIGVLILLLATIIASRLPWFFLLKRLLILSPFVLGVAIVNAWQPTGRVQWQVVAMKSSICLLTVILISNTTPFGKMLCVLKRVRVPDLLVTTIALMHRYLFVLAEESERMRRARASRTFNASGRFRWRMLATVIGQLFLRASERAERIYDAMCSRGWK